MSNQKQPTDNKPSILKFKSNDVPVLFSNEYSFKNIDAPADSTPVKRQSLRDAIMTKISSSKKIANHPTKSVEPEQFQQFQDLKELVIQNQCSNNEGYYSFVNWNQTNQILFADANQHYVTELWKILRIVNFGEVSIPTGLIYEVLAVLKCNINIEDKQQQLVSIVNHFLHVNKMTTNFYTLKQLNNYKPLKEILKNYTGSPAKTLLSAKKSDIHIFDELYKDAKHRSERKAYNSIINHREELKECTFQPRINEYTPSKEHHDHRKHCTASLKKFRIEQPVELSQHKPLQLDRAIFSQKVGDIVGVEQHIKRTMGSYGQRLRLKRMKEKPVVLRHH